MVVFGEKTEHLGHRVHRLTQANPQGGCFRNLACQQLSEGLFEGVDLRGQGLPRSLEAPGLDDAGRRVQALSLDPRPTVEIVLKPRGANRAIGQAMGRQNGQSQAAGVAEVKLDPFFLGSFGVGVAEVMSMTMDGPRTTTGTGRAKSFELIFAKLDRTRCPQSSRLSKSQFLVVHDAIPTDMLPNL